MNNQTFDINKCKRNEDGHLIAQYRNGEPAIILTKKRKAPFSVVSMAEDGQFHCHTQDGHETARLKPRRDAAVRCTEC